MSDLNKIKEINTEIQQFIEHSGYCSDACEMYEDLVEEMFQLIDLLNNELRNQVINYLSLDLGYALHISNDNLIIVMTDKCFSYEISCNDDYCCVNSYRDGKLVEQADFDTLRELKTIIH